jgi:hypothetical protein
MLFKAYSLFSLFSICFTIKVLKWQRGLVYIANIAKLESTYSWKRGFSRLPTIRARENCCHLAVILKPLLNSRSKLFKGLLGSFCAIAKGDTLSSKEPLKPRIGELKTKVFLTSIFRILNCTIRV